MEEEEPSLFAVVVINELRSESVQSRFSEIMAEDFTQKRVAHSKMGSAQHPLIDIYLFRLKTKVK